MSVTIRKSKPLFRPELRLSPAHPIGNRVLVREFPVESEMESGLIKPEVAQTHYFAGTLIAAGDQAADRLYDAGVEIGDEIWYAKYAGLVEDWQHLVAPGNDPTCEHDATWDFAAKDDSAWAEIGEKNENMTLRTCRGCGAKKLSERVIIMTGDDLVLDVDLQVRLERGEVTRKRETDTEGRTRYVLVRPENHVDTFQTVKE